MPPSLALFLVTLVWGSSFVVSKHLVRVLPPVPYLALRYGLAALIMVTLFARHIRRSKRDQRLTRDAVIIGVMNAVSLSFQLCGQLWTTAAKSAFITSLYMPLVPLCARLFYGTRSTTAQLIAVALGTVGLGLLTYPHHDATWNPGDVLTIISALGYAFTIIETSRRSPRHDSIALSTIQVTATAACFAVALTTVKLLDHAHIALPTYAAATPLLPSLATPWIALAYMVLICTVGTFLVQNWALARLPVTQATLIFSLEAPVATLIGLLADGSEEWPGARGAIGGTIMVVALMLSQRRSVRAVKA